MFKRLQRPQTKQSMLGLFLIWDAQWEIIRDGGNRRFATVQTHIKVLEINFLIRVIFLITVMLFHMLNHDTFLIFYILRAREMVYIKNCIKTLYKKMY